MDKLYRINDVLTALAQELGVTFTDEADEDDRLQAATLAVAEQFGVRGTVRPES